MPTRVYFWAQLGKRLAKTITERGVAILFIARWQSGNVCLLHEIFLRLKFPDEENNGAFGGFSGREYASCPRKARLACRTRRRVRAKNQSKAAYLRNGGGVHTQPEIQKREAGQWKSKEMLFSQSPGRLPNSQVHVGGTATALRCFLPFWQCIHFHWPSTYLKHCKSIETFLFSFCLRF